MKILKVLFAILIIMILIIFIGAAFIPSTLSFKESRLIKVDQQGVFDQVNCFENWKHWSPWTEIIQNEKLEGPSCGTGSKMIWEDERGGGTQEIIESNGTDYIKTQLNFRDAASSISEWNFIKRNDEVEVSWSFTTDLAFPLGRWIGILMIKPGLEKSYTRGLAQLENHTKNIKVEKLLGKDEIAILKVKGQALISIKSIAKTKDLKKIYDQNFSKLETFIDNYQLQIVDSPISIWHGYNPAPDIENEFECAIPIKESNIDHDDFLFYTSYSGKVVSGVHYGSYESSYITWNAIDSFIKEQNLENNGSPWEKYIIGPKTESDTTKWVTQIYQPIK